MKKTQRPVLHDMFFDSRKRVLPVRSRSITIHIPKDGIWQILRFLAARRIIVFAVLVIVVIGFAFAGKHPALAETVLHPTTCLGGWVNADRAAGLPDLLPEAPVSDFSPVNAAAVEDTLAEIFCGGFIGSIPESTAPTRFTVHLSWALAGDTNQPVNVTSESFASSTTEIIDAPADSGTIVIPVSDATEAVPEAPATPADVPAPTPSEAPPAPASEPPPAQDAAPADSAPQSLLPALERIAFESVFGTAHAQTISTTSDTSSASTSTPPAEEPIVEVRYTLDGTNWQTLGTATRSNLAAVSFDVPVAPGAHWNDFSKLQISVRTLATVNPVGTLYLDGMTIAAAYASGAPTQDSEIDLAATPLEITAIEDVAGTLHTTATLDGDRKPALEFSVKGGGNLYIYRGGSNTPIVTSGLGDDPLDMPAYFFYPDTYTVLVAGDSPSCTATGHLDVCRISSAYKGESVFTVSFASSTPSTVPAAIPAPDATITPATP